MECLNPKYLPKQDVTVPCGHCSFCGVTKRSDWALRLHYEAKKHVGSKFVTLTYANNALTWDNGVPQLVKRDLQLWLKRVRRSGAKVRYFAVGEYGSRTLRPHYHVILFGDVSEEIIRSEWPHGLVHIGQVTQASIMYCLGYVIKDKKTLPYYAGRVQPFATMSRRPGLGANYLTPEMVEWHKSDKRNYAILDGKKRHLPRYYKSKIFSKIDHVRIAVRDQKAAFKKDVAWLRSPTMARMKDPLSYRDDQRRQLEKQIRAHTKFHNTTI